ncbi:hypothetical protein LQW54_002267 [Pestalotiopsis sp. IQ-011]
MKYGLQYEHHQVLKKLISCQLINPNVVSMPEPDRARLFDPDEIRSDETRRFIEALYTLQADIKEKLVTVTISMRIGDKDWVKKLLKEEDDMMLFHDKVVESLATINPWPETRPRAKTVADPLTNERIFLVLHAILLEGGILLPRSTIRHVTVPIATELW